MAYPELSEVIEALGLQPLPQEGGFFRELYVSSAQSAVGAGEGALPRAAASHIYFVLSREAPSLPHRLRADELWFFHMGSPVQMLLLEADGAVRRPVLGTGLAAGARPSQLVAGGCWQAARVVEGSEPGWALVSCVVTPAFHWDDFELGDLAPLKSQWPAAARDLAFFDAPA